MPETKITSMVLEANCSAIAAAERIYALCQAAYAFEAEQVGCADFPPLRESVGDLQGGTDEFLVFQKGDQIVGVLSFEESGGVATITRLAVDPAQMRRGIATALMEALERRLPSSVRVNVSTAEANTAAVTLYERKGFVLQRTSRSSEGISLIHFGKLPNSNA